MANSPATLLRSFRSERRVRVPPITVFSPNDGADCRRQQRVVSWPMVSAAPVE